MLYYVLNQLLDIFATVIIVRVITDFLLNFSILDKQNRIVSAVYSLLYRLTEPAFRFIRDKIGRFVPLQISGIELTPLVVLLLIWLGQNLLVRFSLLL